MPSLATIYLLTNKVTKKRYVGFTTNPPQRMSGHQSRAKAGSHDFILSNSIRKHGWEAFEYTVLAEHPNAEYAKNVLEPQFIKELNTYYENGQGYNMTWGGEGTLGYKRTPEQCAHLSRIKKGVKLSPERCQQMSEQHRGEGNPNYGKTHSPETRTKISVGIKQALAEGRGRSTWSEERRRRQSEASKIRGNDPKNVERLIKQNKSRAGKPGHRHTEEHKAHMSQIMSGRVIRDESIKKGRLSQAVYVWVLQAPDGTIYETYSLHQFCQHHDVNPKTIEAKWLAKQNDVIKRKGSCQWKVFDKVPINDELRESFRHNLDICWRVVDSSILCKTTSDSNQGASSATISREPKTST